MQQVKQIAGAVAIVVAVGFCPPTKLYGQTLLNEVETVFPVETVFLDDGLFNEDTTLLLVGFGFRHEPARAEHYYLIDTKQRSVVCNFRVDRWTYLHDAYFYKDKLLYISFGIRLRTKYMIFDASQCDLVGKVLAKDSPKGEFYSNFDSLADITSGFDGENLAIVLPGCVLVFNEKTCKIQFFTK